MDKVNLKKTADNLGSFGPRGVRWHCSPAHHAVRKAQHKLDEGLRYEKQMISSIQNGDDILTFSFVGLAVIEYFQIIESANSKKGLKESKLDSLRAKAEKNLKRLAPIAFNYDAKVAILLGRIFNFEGIEKSVSDEVARNNLNAMFDQILNTPKIKLQDDGQTTNTVDTKKEILSLAILLLLNKNTDGGFSIPKRKVYQLYKNIDKGFNELFQYIDKDELVYPQKEYVKLLSENKKDAEAEKYMWDHKTFGEWVTDSLAQIESRTLQADQRIALTPEMIQEAMDIAFSAAGIKKNPEPESSSTPAEVKKGIVKEHIPISPKLQATAVKTHLPQITEEQISTGKLVLISSLKSEKESPANEPPEKLAEIILQKLSDTTHTGSFNILSKLKLNKGIIAAALHLIRSESRNEVPTLTHLAEKANNFLGRGQLITRSKLLEGLETLSAYYNELEHAEENVFTCDATKGDINDTDNKILSSASHILKNPRLSYDLFIKELAKSQTLKEENIGELEIRLRLTKKLKLTEDEYKIITDYRKNGQVACELNETLEVLQLAFPMLFELKQPEQTNGVQDDENSKRIIKVEYNSNKVKDLLLFLGFSEDEIPDHETFVLATRAKYHTLSVKRKFQVAFRSFKEGKIPVRVTYADNSTEYFQAASRQTLKKLVEKMKKDKDLL